MARGGALVEWFREQGLLRGPYLFRDYWASVLGLEGITPEAHIERGFVDPSLFRDGIDRPDVELPGLWTRLLRMLAGSVLVAFHRFRRLGRYGVRLDDAATRRALDGLDRYRLTVDAADGDSSTARIDSGHQDGEPGGHGGAASAVGTSAPRCDVRLSDAVLATNVLDPYRVAGFGSYFWGANKLLVAALVAVLTAAVVTAGLNGLGALERTAAYRVPIGFPLLVIVLFAVFREWLTAILGALPVLLGAYVLDGLGPAGGSDGIVVFWAAVGLVALYVLADRFFVPRPVPPALLFYTADGPGHPYRRPEDAPWWLEGRTYWVWRYLLVAHGELNKFWERDWERVDLWIRADGAEAGQLEWIVTDLHYRELWFAPEDLAEPDELARFQDAARRAAGGDGTGVWRVDADADLVFHTPLLRGVSYRADTGEPPTLELGHATRALRRRVRDPAAAAGIAAMDRLRREQGIDVMGDLPEIVKPEARRRLMASPWTYWRYPFGAASRREPFLYGRLSADAPPAAADRALQVKAP